MIHLFPWVLVWPVFWASGPVLAYCGIICSLQDSLTESFNHLLALLNAGKEIIVKTLVEFCFVLFFLTVQFSWLSFEASRKTGK